MCMITYLAPGITVPENEIWNGATWNDDGHGWAIAAETGVMLSGRYMSADVALDTFVLTRNAFPGAPALFHSRYATHGTVGLSNVHPFNVGRYAAVAHNGILPTKFQPTKLNPDMSDTAILADSWLAGRAHQSGVWTRNELRRVGRIIGTGNKLCILSVSPFLSEPRAYFVNQSAGVTDDGVWYSNSDYRSSLPRKISGGQTVGLWDKDDLYTTPNKSAGMCPLCMTKDHVDTTAGVCLHCDSCIDCLEPLRACQCGYFGTAKQLAESDDAFTYSHEEGDTHD